MRRLAAVRTEFKEVTGWRSQCTVHSESTVPPSQLRKYYSAVQNSTITSHDGGRMVEVTVSLVVRDSLVPSTVSCYGSTYRAVHNNTVQSHSGISCFKA